MEETKTVANEKERLLGQLEEIDGIVKWADTLMNHAEERNYKAAQVIEKEKRKTKYYVLGGILGVLVVPGLFKFLAVLVAIFFWGCGKSIAETKAHYLEDPLASNKDFVFRKFLDKSETMAILPEKYWFSYATYWILHDLRTGRSPGLDQALERFDAHMARLKANDPQNIRVLEQEKHLLLMEEMKVRVRDANFPRIVIYD